MKVADCTVTCPAPGCDYGDNGNAAVFRATTIGRALRMRNDHLRSAHKGFQPPSGSIASRVRRLD